MDTLAVPVAAWIPIRTPVYEHQARYPDFACERDIFVSEIGSAIECTYEDIHVSGVAVSDPPHDVYEYLERRNPLVSAKWVEFISVTATVDLDVDGLLHANPGRAFEESTLKAVAAYKLATAIQVVLVFTELSQPGCIDTLDGVAAAEGGGRQPFDGKSTFLSIREPEPEHPVWPPLNRLALADVMRWLGKTSFFSSGLATTRVERTVAAYSHVVGLTSHRDGDVLFRAMQGLEAFYCDRTGELRKQLSGKVILWLGAWDDKRNIVGQLYDLRSGFIHGSAKLEYWVKHAEAFEEDSQHVLKFDNAVLFAVRLLLATLQQCVARDIVDVRWH